MSSIIEKAHDLGHALSESDEAVILHAAEMNMEQDIEAQALITDFQSRQKTSRRPNRQKRKSATRSGTSLTGSRIR